MPNISVIEQSTIFVEYTYNIYSVWGSI